MFTAANKAEEEELAKQFAVWDRIQITGILSTCHTSLNVTTATDTA
jgi:hypothetical protein